MSLDQTTLNQIKDVLSDYVVHHVDSHSPLVSRGREIAEVRGVYIEDRWFDGLESPRVYSGKPFKVETILGSLSVYFFSSSGGKSHDPSFTPSLVVSGLEMEYDHDDERFVVNSANVTVR